MVSRDEKELRPLRPYEDDEEPPTQHAEPPRYWLDYGGHLFELRRGEFIIGRSAVCQLVLDDVLVSRRHARILVADRTVTLEDLGSANGVELNGAKLDGQRSLVAGDRITIGKQVMVVRTGIHLGQRLDQRRLAAATLSGVEAASLLEGAGLPPRPRSTDGESSQQGKTLDLLGGVADKALALRRGEEAERLLGPVLTSLVEQARGGRLPETKTADQAACYAVKIANVTGKASWIDLAVELFTLLARPLPAEAVEQLYTTLRTVRGVNVNGLRLYVAALRAKQARLGPAERFLVQRIEGLEQLARL